jgi:hypothetical protein
LKADLDAAANAKRVHLAYKQLAAYVDDTLSAEDRSAVEEHLTHCAQCVAEMRDLRAFRAMLTTYPPKEYAPTPRPTVWERFAAFWRSPVHWIPLQVAGTAAIAVLCVWVTTRPLQMQVDELKQTNVALQKKQDPRVAQLTTQLQREREKSQQQQGKLQQERKASQQTIAKLQQEKEKDQKDNAQLKNLIAKLQQSPVTQTQTSSRVADDLKQLAGKQGTLMGSSKEGFDLLSPVGTFVQSDRPTLRWKSLTGATSYEVTVVDSKGDVVATQTVKPEDDAKEEIAWTTPSPLKRGGVYVWQVVATRLKDGADAAFRPAERQHPTEERIKSPPPGRPDAKFKVLGQKELNELNAKKKNAPSPLELAKLYVDYGLLSDAEQTLRTFRMGQKTTP